MYGKLEKIQFHIYIPIHFSRSPENGIQTVVHCATEPTLTEQSGFYYSDCSVQLTSEKGSDMDDAYRYE